MELAQQVWPAGAHECMHVLTRCTSSAGDLDSTRLGLARLDSTRLRLARLRSIPLRFARLDSTRGHLLRPFCCVHFAACVPSPAVCRESCPESCSYVASSSSCVHTPRVSSGTLVGAAQHLPCFAGGRPASHGTRPMKKSARGAWRKLRIPIVPWRVGLPLDSRLRIASHCTV